MQRRMVIRRSRVRLAAAGLMLAAGAGVGGMAFACAPLATLDLDHALAAPGDVIHAEGKGFLSATSGARTVDVRWNKPDGEVLASQVADEQGRVSLSFTVPDSPPGYYVIFASVRDGPGVRSARRS